ncbi:MAG: calcium-binding protein [Pseudodonghicola sp.]
MAIMIDPASAQDVDQPLITNPDYTFTHVFSTNDVTGTFGGLTQGDVLPGEMPVVDFSATPTITKEGVALYPINSEFGWVVTDFSGAVAKDFSDGIYEEGWIGDLTSGGEQIGVVVSDSPTDTFKTPALLGTWLSGLGGNTVKASTEHYVVMQHILSDQAYPGDPDAVYQLDDNLIVIGGQYDGLAIADLLAGTAVDGANKPITIHDENQDGVVDIKDILNPNESTIEYDIAASTDYSVTVKDDGKLLYRWGNTVKRPNDIRLEAELALPDEWSDRADEDDLQPLYKITAAELVVHHTITNNPNDQLRPEDLENEAATGTLPTYEVIADYNLDGKGPREVWVSTDDYYAGDGTLYEAGTILRDDLLADAWANSDLAALGAADGAQGFTNAWYTTMDREPFEPVLNEDGTEYVGSGPRWRLLADKYGQDLPAVDIPLDPSLPPPPTKDELKYEVGAETQTVINLLDWKAPFSPMSVSAGWQNLAGTVSPNGVNMTENLDLAVYFKGDIKPATLYSAEVRMTYDEIAIADVSDVVRGGVGDDYLAGQGDNYFRGGAGSDLFILSYGAHDPSEIIGGSVVADFTVGKDMLGLIGLGADNITLDTAMATTNIGQTVIAGNLVISVDGHEIVTLRGVTEALGAESFYTSTQSSSVRPANTIIGTEGPDRLVGDDYKNIIMALGGDDVVLALGGDDVVYGGTGDDLIRGGQDDDTLFGEDGDDVIYGGLGDDVISGGANRDTIYGGVGADDLIGNTGADVIYGDGGNDVVRGARGDDILFGGAGADVLKGSFGNDTLTGDEGADTFIFTPDLGIDIVTDFTSGEDKLSFDDAIWGGGLTAAEVVSTYASVNGTSVVFDFGGDNTVTLLGVTSTVGLEADLIIV